MIPALKALLHDLLWSETRFRQWSRSLLFGYAVGGATFADQIAAAVAAPRLVIWIRVSAIVAVLLAGLVRAGQKNPSADEVRAMAQPPPAP